ncbi:MAG: thiol peroxidase [Candidatus Melainabacteria bacterium]|jgi:thiol peroxidase|nr:thiol peroxidase [Candidatus Melainabacteria bacterium]
MTTVTFKGNPIELQGTTVQANQPAPAFELLNGSLETITLANFKGKTVLLNVVPSLDTPVCAIQSKTFFSKLQNIPVELVTVSVDLPFAQKRFCGAENIELQTLSDHRETNFGIGYGLLLPNLRLLTRAVIIIDANQQVKYVEVVPEVTNEPNYEAALQALEQVVAAKV